jgi:chemotaxis protein MotA
VDIGTLVGIIGGIGLILGAILLGGGLTSFIDVPSFLIVYGGTGAATLICENMDRVMGAVKVAKNAFFTRSIDLGYTIETILRLSNIARREGVLALENEKVQDTFLEKGLRMAVDGLPQDEIRETLNAELISMRSRHTRGQKLFKFMGQTAPSMGMIGTLIGLVQMLRTLDDPSSIGPAMAVALLTTLYGAVLAFLILNPIAEKLERRTAEETMNMMLVIEGVESIVKGQNAAIIKDKLEARIAPAFRRHPDQAA